MGVLGIHSPVRRRVVGGGVVVLRLVVVIDVEGEGEGWVDS